MFIDSIAPLLISSLVGLTLGILVWGLVRGRSREPQNVTQEAPDGLMIGLLALAAFAMGAFITYMLLFMAIR